MGFLNETIKTKESQEKFLLEYAKEGHKKETDNKYHVYLGRTYMKSFFTEKDGKEYKDSMSNIHTIMIYHEKGP